MELYFQQPDSSSLVYCHRQNFVGGNLLSESPAVLLQSYTRCAVAPESIPYLSAVRKYGTTVPAAVPWVRR